MAKSQKTSRVHKVSLDKYFTTTPNSTAQDSNLSWAAKGLLWHVLSMPEDWTVSTCQLADLYTGKRQKGHGIESIRSILKELIELDYVEYGVTRGEKGYWVHEYHFYPMPFEDYKSFCKLKGIHVERKFQKKIPEGVNPILDKPDSAKACIIQKKHLQKKQTTNVVVVVGETPPISCSDNVEMFITQDAEIPPLQKQSLKVELTKSDVYARALRENKDWTAVEIEEAWEAYSYCNIPITDKYAYIKGIINKKRVLKESKEQNKCNQKQKKKKHYSKPKYAPEETKSEESKPSSDSTLANDMWQRHLQRLGLTSNPCENSQDLQKDPETS